MARRSRKISGTESLVVLIIFLLVAVIMPTVLTLSSYGGLFCLVGGLIYCKARMAYSDFSVKGLPLEMNCSTLYKKNEYLKLLTLGKERKTRCDQKSKIYKVGKAHDLEKRRDGLFDERKPEARRANAKIEKLSEELQDLESKIRELKKEVAERYYEWKDACEFWLFYSAGSKAFGVGLLSYILAATLLLTLQPSWSQQFSIFISNHIWFHTAVLTNEYGPLSIASFISLGVVPLAWFTLHFILHRLAPDPTGYEEFSERWID